MDEATPSRNDYELLLDYDPSGTIFRNLLESFQNILLLTNRSNLPRTFKMIPYTLLTDAVNSALEAQPYQMQYHLLHANLTVTFCYEALTTNKRLMVYSLISYVISCCCCC